MPPMMPYRMMSNPLFFGVETFYTLIIVLLCILIFVKTKEIFDLTKHQGIKYFRLTFLFIALAYATRFLFSLIMVSATTFRNPWNRMWLGPLTMLPMAYFSTISIIYLLFSSVWKKKEHKELLIFAHIVSIILAIGSLLTRSHEILLGLQAALIIIIVLVHLFGMHKKKKHMSQTRILYFSILFFWVLNLGFVTPNRMILPFEIKLIIEAISIGLFAFIYYKVAKLIK